MFYFGKMKARKIKKFFLRTLFILFINLFLNVQICYPFINFKPSTSIFASGNFSSDYSISPDASQFDDQSPFSDFNFHVPGYSTFPVQHESYTIEDDIILPQVTTGILTSIEGLIQADLATKELAQLLAFDYVTKDNIPYFLIKEGYLPVSQEVKKLTDEVKNKIELEGLPEEVRNLIQSVVNNSDTYIEREYLNETGKTYSQEIIEGIDSKGNELRISIYSQGQDSFYIIKSYGLYNGDYNTYIWYSSDKNENIPVYRIEKDFSYQESDNKTKPISLNLGVFEDERKLVEFKINNLDLDIEGRVKGGTIAYEYKTSKENIENNPLQGMIDYKEIGYDELGNIMQLRKLHISGINIREASFYKSLENGKLTLNYPIFDNKSSTRLIGWTPEIKFEGKLNDDAIILEFTPSQEITKDERENFSYEDLAKYFNYEEIKEYSFDYVNSENKAWKIIASEDGVFIHHYDLPSDTGRVYQIKDSGAIKDIVLNYLRSGRAPDFIKSLSGYMTENNLLAKHSVTRKALEDYGFSETQAEYIRKLFAEKLKIIARRFQVKFEELTGFSETELLYPKEYNVKTEENIEYVQEKGKNYKIVKTEIKLEGSIGGKLVERKDIEQAQEQQNPKLELFLKRTEEKYEIKENGEEVLVRRFVSDPYEENSDVLAEITYLDKGERWKYEYNRALKKVANQLGYQNLTILKEYENVLDSENGVLHNVGLAHVSPEDGEVDRIFYIEETEEPNQYNVYLPESKSAPLLKDLLEWTKQQEEFNKNKEVVIDFMQDLKNEAFAVAGQGAIEGEGNLFDQLKNMWEGYKDLLKIECERMGYEFIDEGLKVKIVKGEDLKAGPVLAKKISIEQLEGGYVKVVEKSGGGRILKTSILEIDTGYLEDYEEGSGKEGQVMPLEAVAKFYIRNYLGASENLFEHNSALIRELEYDSLGRLRKYIHYDWRTGRMEYAVIPDPSKKWIKENNEIKYERIMEDIDKSENKNIDDGLVIYYDLDSEKYLVEEVKDGKEVIPSTGKVGRMGGWALTGPLGYTKEITWVFGDLLNSLDITEDEVRDKSFEVLLEKIVEKAKNGDRGDVSIEKSSNGSYYSITYDGYKIEYNSQRGVLSLRWNEGQYRDISLTIREGSDQIFLEFYEDSTPRILRYFYNDSNGDILDNYGNFLDFLLHPDKFSLESAGYLPTKKNYIIPSVEESLGGKAGGKISDRFFGSIAQFRFYSKLIRLYEDIFNEPGNDKWFDEYGKIISGNYKAFLDDFTNALMKVFTGINEHILNAVNWITGKSGAKGEKGIWNPDRNYIYMVDSVTIYNPIKGGISRDFAPLDKDLFITEGYDGLNPKPTTFSNKEDFMKWVDSLIGDVKDESGIKLSRRTDFQKLKKELWKAYSKLEPWEFYVLLRGIKNNEELQEKYGNNLADIKFQHSTTYGNISRNEIVDKYRNYLKYMTLPLAGDSWTPSEGQLTEEFREFNIGPGHIFMGSMILLSILTEPIIAARLLPMLPSSLISAVSAVGSAAEYSKAIRIGLNVGRMLVNAGRISTGFLPINALMTSGQMGKFDFINFVNGVDESFVTTYFYSLIFGAVFNPYQLGVGSGEGGLIRVLNYPFSKFGKFLKSKFPSFSNAIESNIVANWTYKGLTNIFSYGDRLTRLMIGPKGASFFNPRYLPYIYVSEGLIEENLAPLAMAEQMESKASITLPTGIFGIKTLKTLARANLRSTETFGSMAELSNPLENPFGFILIPGMVEVFSRNTLKDIAFFKIPLQ